LSYSLDIIFLVGFLFINLFVGLYSGKGIRTIKEYALGDRNFPTVTLAATIVATWVSSNSLTITIAETYNSGLYYIIPGLADTISFLVIAFFIAPRMGEFLGCLSVAEAMGKLYGNKAKSITAILGIFPAVGNVATQFIIASILLQNLIGISSLYASLLSAFIVICYATFGGIKSVTFTDMIQFLTFGVIIPTIAIAVFQNISGSSAIFGYLANSELYEIKDVFNVSNPKFFSSLVLFTFLLIPGLDSAIFQRISMAKDTKQVTKAFLIATGFCFLIDCMFYFIAFAMAAKEQLNLGSNDLILHLINTYTPSYLKGIAIIGVLAMIMSTADSYINSSSVLFSYDFCRSIGIKLSGKTELLLARISSLIIGIAALALSLISTNLLEVLLVTYSFYMPVVSVPLLLAIFGFRTNVVVVLSGMFMGFITIVLFMLFSEIDGFIHGMLANLTTLIIGHCIVKKHLS